MIPNPSTKKIFLLRTSFFLIITLFAAVFLVASYFTEQEKKLSDKIFPNVYIDNQNMGGKTKKDVSSLYEKRYDSLKVASLSVVYKDQPIATFSAQRLNIHSDVNDIIDRAYLIARVSRLSSRIHQKIMTLFNWGRYDFSTKVTYDKSVLSDFITQIEQQYNVPAKNALFDFENSRAVTFRPEENGTKIQSDQLVKDIDTAVSDLKKNPGNKTLTLQETILQPEITLAKANQFGIEELIGEGQSNYTHSIPERVHNVLLAASKIHGVLVPKGEVFSFNSIIGDISSSTGYVQAYIIKNGKTVLGDGGGVCQVSTTLFRAALNSGLPITERVAHAYRVGYYENDSKPGFDATVFNPYADFKFKNDTSAAILIQTEIDKDNNILRFKFYGKKDGRQVLITVPTLTDQQPPPPAVYQDDPTLKKGTVKQVDFAAWGGKANFYYKVTKDGQTLYEKNFYSVFQPWQAVFLVGQAD